MQSRTRSNPTTREAQIVECPQHLFAQLQLCTQTGTVILDTNKEPLLDQLLLALLKSGKTMPLCACMCTNLTPKPHMLRRIVM